MNDGVVKSDPDAVWKYYVSLNKYKGYLSETVKDYERAFEALADRVNRKLASLPAEEEELENVLRNARKRISVHLDTLHKEYQECANEILKARKILNAYLKMLEIHTIQTEMRDPGIYGGLGRDGIIDYRGTTFYCDSGSFPPTPENLERMEYGNAPVGYDGKPVELHHMIQSEEGGIMEISSSRHKTSYKTLHFTGSETPSGIDRGSFNILKQSYWKKRAKLIRSMMKKN